MRSILFQNQISYSHHIAVFPTESSNKEKEKQSFISPSSLVKVVLPLHCLFLQLWEG